MNRPRQKSVIEAMAVLLLSISTFSCAPAVDSPQQVSTPHFEFDLPGNWVETHTDKTARVDERLFIGQIQGPTYVSIESNAEVDAPKKSEVVRTVKTEVAGEEVVGSLYFFWNETERFVERYCFDQHELCVEVGSDKANIERARPGVDLVLESLKFKTP